MIIALLAKELIRIVRSFFQERKKRCQSLHIFVQSQLYIRMETNKRVLLLLEICDKHQNGINSQKFGFVKRIKAEIERFRQTTKNASSHSTHRSFGKYLKLVWLDKFSHWIQNTSIDLLLILLLHVAFFIQWIRIFRWNNHC